MLAGYGAQGVGQFNDGVNLELAKGSKFCAVGDGEVRYVGNELLSYGTVILVKHGNGWMSVYAHVREPLVAVGDHVTRGQVIGIAGNSGRAIADNTGKDLSTQLHFELRHFAAAQDPIAVLGH